MLISALLTLNIYLTYRHKHTVELKLPPLSFVHRKRSKTTSVKSIDRGSILTLWSRFCFSFVAFCLLVCLYLWSSRIILTYDGDELSLPYHIHTKHTRYVRVDMKRGGACVRHGCEQGTRRSSSVVRNFTSFNKSLFWFFSKK